MQRIQKQAVRSWAMAELQIAWSLGNVAVAAFYVLNRTIQISDAVTRCFIDSTEAAALVALKTGTERYGHQGEKANHDYG